MKTKRSYFGKISILLTVALIVLSAVGITIFASAAETDVPTYTAEPVTAISSAEDLQKFADSVNTGGLTYEGQEVVLQNDILWEGTWQSINQFNGTFNGQGHTISGFTDAFITTVGETGKIENLNIRSNIWFSKGNIGGIVDINEGIISGCTFGGILNSEEGESENGCGGIAGDNFYGRIENCSTTSDTIIHRKGAYVGGIAGISRNDTSYKPFVPGIYNCVNNATVEVDTSALINISGAMGGICGYLICTGYAYQLKNMSISIQDCINNGDLTSHWACTGGIVGISENGKITGCQNNGNINQLDNHWTGGIVGSFNQKVYKNSNATDAIYIKNCINRGNVTGMTRVGGIVGGDETNYTTSYYMTIEDCINTGDITTNGYGGGISGYNTSKIKRCYNTGNVYANLIGQELTAVDGWSGVGGIAAVNANEISYCFNIGEVKIDVDEPLQYVGISGGLIGRQDYIGKIIYSYNSGPVTGNHNSSTNKTKSTVYYGGLVGKGDKESVENCAFNKTSAGKAERAIGSYIGEDSDLGLKATEMMGEAAKENMPYLFEDGVFEIMEDITIDGVHYSFTPVLADIENPYSIDPDKMMSNASYAYVKVILPQGDGYLVAAAESYDPNHIEIGGDFGFYVTLDEAYKNYDVIVTANGEIITPTSEGIYYLTNLQSSPNLEVSLKAPEIVPNNPAQNENASDNSNTNNTNNTIEQVENAKTGDVAIMEIILLALICGIVTVVFAIKKRNKK